MARNRFYYLVALCIAVTCYVLYEKWFSWFFLTAMLTAPVLSVLLAIPTALRLRLMLWCPDTVERGQSATGLVQVSGSFLRPACKLRLRTRTYLAGTAQQRRIRLTSANAMQFALPTDHCDILELSVENAKIYDYFGLFTLPVRCGAPVQLTVLPRLREPEAPPDTDALEHPPLRPMAPGTFAEVHELRDYRPGDSLRDVHWKLSAKTDDLVVREPLGPERPRALVTVDLAGTPEQRDQALEDFRYLAQWLLDRELPFCTRWAGPAGSVWIRTQWDLHQTMLQMLREPVQDGAWLNREDRGFTWHCHLCGRRDPLEEA